MVRRFCAGLLGSCGVERVGSYQSARLFLEPIQGRPDIN